MAAVIPPCSTTPCLTRWSQPQAASVPALRLEGARAGPPGPTYLRGWLVRRRGVAAVVLECLDEANGRGVVAQRHGPPGA